MKYFIYLFLFLSLIMLGCYHDKVQPTPTPEPAPAPQPPIWQPKPDPTPTPDPVTCTDTDGGSDVNVKGTTTKGELIRTDTCDGNRVLEYYCTDNDLYELSQVCTYGCSNGACTGYTPTPSPSGIPPGANTKCSDSESGDDPLRVGTVTVEYAEYGSSVYQTYGTWSDSCISSYTVQEVSCDNTKPDRYGTKSVSCPSGKTCSGGKCGSGTTPPPSSCTDSDGGKNYDVKGTVMKGSDEEGRSTDVCLTLTPTVLAEFYCDSSGNIRSEEYTCPNGCSDGACTSATSTDDDRCTYNSQCGYKQICSDGVCEDVQCTTDSQCSGCRRCSYNSCVKCPQGPYGCTC